MVVGEGLFVASLLTLRAVACGNVVSLSLDSNLGRRFSPFPISANIVYVHRYYHNNVVKNGGGGRIRTFEVDDGRFTVCSLWPLGNPTRGNSNFEVKLRDGGGGRIIRRFAPHPSGRCLRQRCLAFARLEPWSKILTLPDKCKHRLRSSVLPQQRGKEWWWGKDSNLRSR